MDQEKLLSLLMQYDLVSGSQISRPLGVTRAGVWKAIDALRAQGYNIISVPRKGYRLEPPENAVWPSCIRAHLKAKWIAQRIDYYDATGSTNRIARALGSEDASAAPHGTMVIADEQESGRGRMTRSWISKKGDAVLMSLLLRPQNTAPDEAAVLVQVTALAVCEACRSLGAPALIKWPNDIVADGLKLCGILLEMNADMDQVHYAVAGMGLNVLGSPRCEDIPHAGCLAEVCPRVPSRAEAAARILEQYEKYYDLWAKGGASAIRPFYEERCVTLGRRVRVSGLTETFEGTARALTADGSLEVVTDAGEKRVVRAGDVSVRGIMGYV